MKIHKLQFKNEEVETNNEGLMLTIIKRLVHTFQHTVIDVIIFLKDIDVMTATLRRGLY